ncbi:transient receptor potential cation channel subfamily A member 1 homolog [Cherax quadricarinatus]|uniref:transient receptor potential cation channel subfamily A member 1 homolog n=1 Tax=Cherax quadricarinatus TaxID=27406 RepID=UPI00387EDB54
MRREACVMMEDRNSTSTKLHSLAMNGELDVLDRLLLDGADCNTQDSSGNSSLHYAAYYGHRDCCKRLLQCPGLKVNAVNNDESSPLHFAAQRNHLEIIELLMSNGADVNLRNNEESLPLHYAAKIGCKDSCQALLSRVSSDERETHLRATDVEGKTPLMLSVMGGHEMCFDELKNTDINIKDKEGNTALHYAVISGSTNAVEKLVKMKANRNEKNKNGTTAVLAAASKQMSACLKYIAEEYPNYPYITNEIRANLYERDNNNKNILHYAAEKNAENCLKYLFTYIKREDILNDRDKDKNTPLHTALICNNFDCAHLLLEEGASPAKRGLEGMTPLHLAADKDCTSICEILLANAEVQVSQENDNGETALHLAARRGSVDICRRLLQKGACLSATDKNGQTALHSASVKGNASVVKFLIKRGIPTRIKDNYGSTAMHLAASAGSLECCQLLVVSDEEMLCVTDKNGSLPLDRAFEHNHDSVFKYLLQQLPYDSDEKRMICLHQYAFQALETNRPVVVESLVDSSWWQAVFIGPNGHKCENFRNIIKHHPDLALKLQDKCITYSDSEVTYDFRLFEDNFYIPPENDKIAQSPYDTESGKLREDAAQFIQDRLEWKKCHPVNLMVEHNLLQLLQHSLTKAWLRHKWKSYLFFVFLILLLLEICFVISLSFFLKSADTWRNIEKRGNITREKYCNLSTTQKTVAKQTSTSDSLNGSSFSGENEETLMMLLDNSTIIKFMERHQKQPAKHGSVWVLLACTLTLMILDINCMYQLRNEYLNTGSVMRLCRLLLTIVVIVPGGTCEFHYHILLTGQWVCGILVILVEWFCFIELFNQLPTVFILLPITRSFLKRFVLVAFYIASLVITFAFIFHMQLKDQADFITLPQAIIKTIMWMFSDLAYNDTFLSDTNPLVYPVLTNLVFLIFVISVTIIIANLLITRSSEKLNDLREKAVCYQAASQCITCLKFDVCYPFFHKYGTREKINEKLNGKNIYNMTIKRFVIRDTEKQLHLEEHNKQLNTLATQHLEEIQDLKNCIRDITFYLKEIRDIKHQIKDISHQLKKNNEMITISMKYVNLSTKRKT